MPMASTVSFSSAAESCLQPSGLTTTQNSNYLNSQVYHSAHIASVDQTIYQRHSSEQSVPYNTESLYRGSPLQMREPRLEITEQPKSSWRYRYQSEKGSHGGLPGCTSSQSRRTYPTVKLHNFNGNETVYIRATLWTNDDHPSLHVHKLQGQRCEPDGSCFIKLSEDKTATFQDMSILFVAKKEVPGILLKRKTEKPNSSCISETEKKRLKGEAEEEARRMNLSSVKICFEALCYGPDMVEHTILCPPVFSNPVANQKSPDAGDLKICRMSRCTGSCLGGQEVFLLCTKVNKKEINVRLYDDSNWEDFGKFTEADVHYQCAIVFKTPKYRSINIASPVRVYVQLVRKNGDVSDPKEFTYVPHNPDDEGIGRKRKKNNPFEESDGPGNGSYASMMSFQTTGFISGSIQSPGVENESINGSTLGSNHCIGHSNDLESSFIDDTTVSEDFIDFCSSDADSFDGASLDGGSPFTKHDNPLLSSANVEKPIWSLRSSGTSPIIIEGNMASSDMQTDSLSSDGTEKVKSVKQNHSVEIPHIGDSKLKTSEELQLAFSKLSVSDGGSARQCTVNLSENMLKKTVFPDPVTEKMWMNLSLAVRKGSFLYFLRNIHHLIGFSNEDGDTLLHLSVIHQHNNLQMLESLLKATENRHSIINFANKMSQTPLHLSVMMKNHSHVKLLLKHGADPYYPDRNGCTSFHLAANVNAVDSLYELLNCKNYNGMQERSNVDHFNHEGFAPLHIAVNRGFIDCIKHLCDNGANINISSKKDGRRPLHFAVFKDREIIKLLLSQKHIDVNAQDYGGNTALHLACASKRPDIVRELMLQDANPLIENFDYGSSDPDAGDHVGRTPWDFADKNEKIINILAGTIDGQEAFNMSANLDRSVKPHSQAVMHVHIPLEPVAVGGPQVPDQNNGLREVKLDKTTENAAQTDSGFISGSVSVLQPEALKKVCELLDPPSDLWETLLLCTGFDDTFQENIKKLAPRSPTKFIIEAFLRDGGDMETLLGALDAGNLTEAQDVVKRFHYSEN